MISDNINSISKADLESAGRQAGNDNYGKLPTKYQTLIAFGMVPIEVKDKAESLFKDAVSLVVNERFNNELNPDNLKSAVTPQALNTFMRGFVLGLFDAAKTAGKMVA